MQSTAITWCHPSRKSSDLYHGAAISKYMVINKMLALITYILPAISAGISCHAKAGPGLLVCNQTCSQFHTTAVYGYLDALRECGDKQDCAGLSCPDSCGACREYRLCSKFVDSDTYECSVIMTEYGDIISYWLVRSALIVTSISILLWGVGVFT